MKRTGTIGIAFVLAAAFFLLGRMTSSRKVQAATPPTTTDNLSTAMHGEAFAYAKHMLYARHAQQSGHPDLATLFQQNAQAERFEHFAEEAQLAGLVGSDADNLREAIKGENYEYTTMYPAFAHQAQQEGKTAVAQRFNEIRKDEAGHRDAFRTALNKLSAANHNGKPSR